MAVLEAIQLTRRYQDTLALNQLNLSVSEGEVFCLLGQNGAGKTTTINLFLGFIEASSGQLLINGEEVKAGSSETNKYVAYIPEVVQLYGNLTAVENLQFFSELAGHRYAKPELEGMLLEVGLQQAFLNKPLRTFSKGMRQKVAIAMAVAKKVKVIFMDEPTSGLDPKATAEFSELVRQLSAKGTTIFMATHDIFNAVSIATTIGIMKQGELVQLVDAKDINAEQLQTLYLNTI